MPEEGAGHGQAVHFANAARRGGDVNIVNAGGGARNQLANVNNTLDINMPGDVGTLRALRML